MSWVKIKETEERIAELVATNRSILDGDEVTAEQRSVVEQNFKAIEQKQADLANLRKVDELQRSLADHKAGREAIAMEPSDEDHKREVAEAFAAYCIRGNDMSPRYRAIMERESERYATDPAILNALRSSPDPRIRSLSYGSDPGTSLIGQSFNPVLYEKLKYFGGMRKAALVRSTPHANPFKQPILDDTGNVGNLDTPGGSVTEGVNPTTSNVLLNAHIIDSGIQLLDLDFLMAEGVNLQQTLPNMLGIRLGRKDNALFTSGTGSSQPTGAFHSVTNTLGAASATAVAFDDLNDLIYKVDYAYNDSDAGEECAWMFNQTTWGVIQRLQDSNNRPIFNDSGSFGVTDEKAYSKKLMGYPVIINNDMPNIPSTTGTNTKAIAFGNWKRYYVIRDVENSAGFIRFNEVYMKNLQVGFMAYHLIDGAVLDSNAVWALNFN